MGEISALLSAFLWAFTTILVRALGGRVDAWSLNALRCAIAALALLLLWPFTPGRTNVTWSPQIPVNLLFLALAVFFGAGMGDTLYFKAAEKIGVSRALPIASAYPLLTTLIAVLFLNEAVTPRVLLGACLCLVGIAALASDPNERKGATASARRFDAVGVKLAVAAAASWTLTTVLLKPPLAVMDGMTANTLRMLFGAAIAASLAVVPQGDRTLALAGKRDALVLVSVGVLTALVTLTFVLGIEYGGAAKTAILSSTSPLFATPMSLLLLKERVTGRVILGTVLAVLGVWLVF